MRGRVQGVGFRAYVWREASEFDIRGWARNRYDGSVEVLGVGSVENLRELERRLGEGPRWSRVDSVDSSDEAGVPTTAGFAIRPDA